VSDKILICYSKLFKLSSTYEFTEYEARSFANLKMFISVVSKLLILLM